MQPARTYRILIADPQHLFRKGLKTILSSQPDLNVIGEVSTLNEVVEMAGFHFPEAVALNSGLLAEVAEERPARFKELSGSLPLLIVTDDDDWALLESARQDCVSRSAESSAILAAVRLRAYRSRQEDSPEMASGLQALAQSMGKSTLIPGLTARETEVLRLLTEHLTAREIAHDLGLSIKTVEAHKLNLMRKLGIHDRASLIRYAVAHDAPRAIVA